MKLKPKVDTLYLHLHMHIIPFFYFNSFFVIITFLWNAYDFDVGCEETNGTVNAMHMHTMTFCERGNNVGLT